MLWGNIVKELGLLGLLAVLLTAPAVMADRPYGWDASYWDMNISSSEWEGIYDQDYMFCYTKATDGVAGRDWTFANNMERGTAAGVLMGAFHFARPATNTAVAEADYFVEATEGYITNGYLRPCLDLEDGYTLGATALSQWVNDWMDRVEELTGVEPIIYTGTNYATNYLNSTVADRDLWIAYWPADPDPQTDNPPIGVFNAWAFWQFTDHGTIEGLSEGALEKDIDVFNGTLSGLQDYVISGVTAPLPSFVVESRLKGQNYAYYSETGTWADASAKSSAPGCTNGPGCNIGSRYCTINSTAKTAVFSFTPEAGGTYEVFTTNCNTSNSGNPLVHKVTHAGGTATVNVCQNSTCGSNAINKWYSLGQYTLNANTQYTVTLDGSTTAGSAPGGNVGRSDAVKWKAIQLGGPTITQQPAAQNVCSGSNASFSVSASGQGTLTYQWRKNGANMSNGGHYSGCTTATLSVTGADGNDVANYSCAVTDSTGTTNSNQAALTLKAATAVTQQPSNQFVSSGGTATFSVGATGAGTLTYQWQKNQSNLSNGGHYSGCTTATLTISSADSNDEANYRCVVAGDCGNATSNEATLTISSCATPTLSNGDFEGGNTGGVGTGWTGYRRATNPTTVWTIQTTNPPTGGGSQYQQIANTSATGGGGVRQNATGCTVGASYTIAGWMRTNSASATCTVKCSPTASTNWATAVDLSPAQSTTSSSWVAFSGSVTATGTSMTIWLDGHTGGTGLNKASCFDSVTVTCDEPSAPTITQQPTNQSVASGGTAQFSVTATGGGTLTYQWQKNQSNLSNGGHYSGCTTATLTISNADTNDEANYRCVVTNEGGSTNSNEATLTVTSCSTPTLTNGNFEGGNTSGVGTGWTGYQRATNPTTVWTIQTANPPTGGGYQYQQIANTSATGGGGVRQNATGCTVNASYTIAGWMRTNSASATCTVKCSPTASTNWATAVNLSPTQTTTSSSWVAFSGTVTATGTSMTVWLDGHTGGTGLNKASCFDSVTVTCAE